jgi:hypothetical protein
MMISRLGTAAATSALFLVFSSLAAADDHRHGGALDARQHGYEHGYRDGFHRGLNDHDRHLAYRLDNDDYKHADVGYEKYMGDKDEYKSGYRQGYQAGYDDAFNGHAGRFSTIYGPMGEPPIRGDADRYDDVYSQRGWGGRDVAFDIGYRDGLSAGNDDFTHHREFKPEHNHDYKEADHGFRSNYGDKEIYKRNYRDGFTQGYRDGFRGTSRGR